MIENIKELIKQEISEEELIKLIRDLTKIPSYTGIPEQETQVAKYINNLFKSECIESELIHVIDGRSNVIAEIKGSGKGKRLLLTGHMDTVPPYDMRGNPFDVRINDGKLYGRGVLDMKGPLSCMILAMIAIKRAGIELEGDLIFAGVIDEELKSEGTRSLIKNGISADAAIVGEPSEMEICIGHRGLEWFEFYFEGKSVHGGKQDSGINAISKANKFITNMEEKLIPKIKERKHPIIGNSSMNYGYIQGGTQPSTVPEGCILQVDRRWIPGESYQDIIREYSEIIHEIKKEDHEFNCYFKVMDNSYMEKEIIHEAMEIDENHPIIKIITDIGINILNRKPKKTSFPGWTDGGLLAYYANIPTVVFAPGNIETAHSANEFIEIKDLYPATLIYALTAIEFCGYKNNY